MREQVHVIKQRAGGGFLVVKYALVALSTTASLLSSPNSVMTTLFILDMSSALVNSADQYIGVGFFYGLARH